MALLSMALLVLSPAFANAVDSAGRHAVRGIGQISCAEFSRTLPSNPTIAHNVSNWLAGYLSAVNRYETDTYDIAAWHDDLYLLNLVRLTCDLRPSMAVAQAVEDVGRSLLSSRVAAYSPLQTVTGSNGQTVRLYADVIRRIQAVLGDLGLYQGALDGTVSAQLLDAVGKFQRIRNLPVTGLPDQQTLYQMFNGAPTSTVERRPDARDTR